MPNVKLSYPLNSLKTTEEIEALHEFYFSHVLCGFQYIKTEFDEMTNDGFVCFNFIFKDRSQKKYYNAVFSVNASDVKDVEFLDIWEVKPAEYADFYYMHVH